MDNAQFEEFKALFAPISMLALEDMRNRPPLLPAMDAGYPLPVAVKPEPEPELPYAPPSRLPDDPSTGGSREDLGDI